MALISSTIPNLVNGVSQQPFSLRLSSQAEGQTNFYSSVVEGLKRRAPTEHVAKLSATSWGSAFLHTINRDAVERYIVEIHNGDLKVFDLAGVEKTVTFPNGKTYLAGATKDQFRAVTVADYTFIVNQTVTAAMGAGLTPTRNPEAVVSVRAGNYGKTYAIDVNGSTVATYTTADGGAAIDSQDIDTTNIATELYNDLIISLTTGWAITRTGASIHIERTTGADFTIKVEDGAYDTNMKVAKGSVQRFSDLPKQAPTGFHLEVVGDDSTNFDNYYVEEQADLVWKETVAQGIPATFNPSTLPHSLVRNGDGTFTFGEIAWGSRTCGDEASAPAPSFIGRKITDIFFYRNRLGFLADENVVFSRAGGFFEFFPETVTTIVDSDPIDVAASHVKVSTLRHAVPFAERLLLFSDQTQFVINSGDLLTPTTISINQTTEFEASLKSKPVGAGKNVYFAVNRGMWSGIREYFVEADEGNDAIDVTSHAPKYVPGNIFKLAAATNEDLLIALSEDDQSALFVYKYYWGEAGKLQSSWSKWALAATDTILNIDFIESKLYLIVERSDGVYLETINMEAGATDTGSAFLYRNDRKIYETDFVSAIFDGTDTTFTLPYAEDADLWVFIRAGDPAGLKETYTLNHTRPSSTTVKVTGDHSASYVCIGRKYTSTYNFSPFMLKEDAVGGGQSPIGEGRLQILYLSLDYNLTGHFKVDVTPSYRDTYTYIFTGRIIGSGNNKIGVAGLETGRFKLPVYARNLGVDINIHSDHFLPCAFMSAEWEANYSTRSRRS